MQHVQYCSLDVHFFLLLVSCSNKYTLKLALIPLFFLFLNVKGLHDRNYLFITKSMTVLPINQQEP